MKNKDKYEVYVVIDKKTKKPIKELGLMVYTNKNDAKDVLNEKKEILVKALLQVSFKKA